MATRFDRKMCGAHSKPTATALASMGILTLGLAPLLDQHAVVAAEPDPVVVAAEAGAAPRALMRVPPWIDSIGTQEASGVSQPLQLAKQFPRVTETVAIENASATDLPPAESGVSATLEEPARLPVSPGGRLLRSHQPKPQSFATLTSGWTEISEEEEGASPVEAATAESLGPDESVLQTAAVEEVPAASENDPLAFAAADNAGDAGEDSVVDSLDPTAAESEALVSEDASAVPPQPGASETAPTLAIDPASFRGVLPGTTTREELLESWGDGEAFVREDGSEGLFWEMPPFKRVEVVLGDDVVQSIYIRLAEPSSVDALAKQLEIDDLRTVSVLDADGVAVGEVFPERGVIFSLDPGTTTATALMLEPLDPEAFVLRAEGEFNTSVANAVTDLQYAVEVDPEYQRAHRLLLVLLCDQGRWLQAADVAAATETLAPNDSWTLLKHASVMLELGRYDEAIAKTRQVIEGQDVPPLVMAQAERQMGQIELELPSTDYQKALNHFTSAIKLAAPLTENPAAPLRRAALDIELDSHLGTALAIASGTWQQKDRVLPKWIARAEGFARKLAEEEDGNPTLELRLCQGALAVSAASVDGDSPMPWIKRLLTVRSAIGSEVTDPWRRRKVDWEVGQALADALRAAELRGDTTDMLDNATLTAAYLERGSQQRDLTPDERKEFGDLLFRIGILYSLQKGDHETAVTWFDKALPLWERNESFVYRGEIGRLGEAYVSMAISYWQVDRRPEAVDLCSTGVDMMVTAVDANEMQEQALAVGYGNLSTMYAEQGDAERSEMYAEMASRAEATGTRQ